MVVNASGRQYTYANEPCKIGVAEYPNGNTALVFLTEDGKGYEDDLSTNIMQLAMGVIALDVNNYPNATDFVRDYGIAIPMGMEIRSGFVSYPIYILTEGFIGSLERKF